MRFNFRKAHYACGALLLAACAPQQPQPTETTPTPPPRKKPLVIVTATPDPARKTVRKNFDPENPDWELRYQELYERFAEQFTPPALGQSIEVELKNGTRKNGVLKSLSPSELTLEIPNGEVTYNLVSLSETSAANFFEAAYARGRALEQGRREYIRWERMQAAANPTPTPTPSLSVREIANGGKTRKPAATPGGNTSVDVPIYTSNVTGIPKNEGPTGRVAQVDEYIRKHAAIPHSLRVKAWGRVQKHNSGYKVRVQYSLESADGFGTSNEDMMFFMNADGRVYQKAAVK